MDSNPVEALTALVFLMWAISDVWAFRRMLQKKEEPSPFLILQIFPLLTIFGFYALLSLDCKLLDDPTLRLAVVRTDLISIGSFQVIINLNGRVNSLTMGCIRWMRQHFKTLIP